MSAYDVIVIGAGPAGLSAAIELARYDFRVLLLDEQKGPGGQVYRNLSVNIEPKPGKTDIFGQDYWRGRNLLDSLEDSNLTYIPGATVWTVENPNSLLAVGYIVGKKNFLRSTRHIILATGAYERSVPIPGWTLPGVMTAGAAQILMKESGSIPSGRTVLAGSGPLLQLVTNQLLQAGTNIVGYIETSTISDYILAAPYLPRALVTLNMLLKGLKMRRGIKKSGIPMFSGVTSLNCVGTDKFEGIQFEIRGRKYGIEADLLLLHEGVVPNVQLTRLMSLKHEWMNEQRYWKPVLGSWGNSSNDRVHVTGDGGGIDGALVAEVNGRIAALDVVTHLGAISIDTRDRIAAPLFASKKQQKGIRRLLDHLYPPPQEIVCPTESATVICRCEEVNVQEILACIESGCTGPNQLKAYSRCGMGPCQGRLCGLPVSEIIAKEHNVPIEQVDYYNVRPPIKPIPMSNLAVIDTDPACAEV